MNLHLTLDDIETLKRSSGKKPAAGYETAAEPSSGRNLAQYIILDYIVPTDTERKEAQAKLLERLSKFMKGGRVW